MKKFSNTKTMPNSMMLEIKVAFIQKVKLLNLQKING